MPILMPDGRPAAELAHTQIADAIAEWAKQERQAGTPEARLVVALIDTLAALLTHVDDGQPTKDPLVKHTLDRLAAGLQRLAEQHGDTVPPGRIQ